MLQTLRGSRAMPSLGSDLATLLDWPAELREQLGELLQPALGPKLDDRLTTRLKRIAADHKIDPAILLPPLKALRFLLREGARNATGKDAFIADIKATTDEDKHEALLSLVVPLAEQAYPQLRQEVLFRSIAEHGNVVREVHWRTDLMQSSDHALGLDVPLTSLTFNYQDGQTPRRITLQLLPNEIQILQKALTAALDQVGD